MKHLISILSVFLITACVHMEPNFHRGLAQNSATLIIKSERLEYSKDTLIIFFDADVGEKYLLEAMKEVNAKVIYRYSMMNGMAIKLAQNDDVNQRLQYFQKIKGVLSVERDYITKMD